MKKRNNLLLLIFLLTITQVHAQDEVISKIFFKSGARGWQESIELTKDSIIVIESGSLNKQKNINATITNEEWANLINLLAVYKLNELENLPSPTHQREVDGASHSHIQITTTKQTYECGMFDSYTPHEKLVKLMQAMLDLKEKRQ